MRQIKEADLPRNGYIVTLLLWAIAQNNKFEAINESVLIMNMADFLLGKADFTKALHGEFDATSKEITLQEIANHLRIHGGAISQNDLATFLIEYFKTLGLGYDVLDVIDTLCNCGILKKMMDLLILSIGVSRSIFRPNILVGRKEILRRPFTIGSIYAILVN